MLNAYVYHQLPPNHFFLFQLNAHNMLNTYFITNYGMESFRIYYALFDLSKCYTCSKQMINKSSFPQLRLAFHLPNLRDGCSYS
jgi:hypothetical protein